MRDDYHDEDEGYRYTLAMMDDMSNCVRLEPTKACTARSTAQHLLTWCKIIGVPKVWVSDTASSLKSNDDRVKEISWCWQEIFSCEIALASCYMRTDDD